MTERETITVKSTALYAVPSKGLERELRMLSGWTGEFTLGYLLGMLPKRIVTDDDTCQLSLEFSDISRCWRACYYGHTANQFLNVWHDAEPENAVCMLAIWLFKCGIATPEEPRQ